LLKSAPVGLNLPENALMQLRRFAILSPRFEERDAVGNDMLGMREALRAAGFEAELFARDWGVDAGVQAARVIPRFLSRASDCLIYHYAIAWDYGLELLAETRYRRIVRYHNVTPPEYFAPFNAEYARLCRIARDGIAPMVRAMPDLYLCDSQYNAGELLHTGAEEAKVSVLAPFHRIEELLAAPADSALQRALGVRDRDPARPFTVLAVGRVVPNKKLERIFAALALLRRTSSRAVRVIIAGKRDPALDVYNRALVRAAEDADLSASVWWLEQLSEAELRACYEAADLFALPSDHEGFSVPLVEAMALGAPILAHPAAAVPETVGDAGLLCDANDPALWAAAIARLQSDPQIREELSRRGRERYGRVYAGSRIQERFFAALDFRAVADSGVRR
jgi:glycosyltransferase involved in cell wall biosynthesis